MEDKKVSIIILTWNGLGYTRKCLDSLQKNTYFNNYEVVIVDNGSSDGTIEYLESIKWIKLIKNNKNEGFVKGNNIGIKAASGTDIVLLNNDMVITQKDWLQKLQEIAYSAVDTGIVGCRLLNADNLLLHAGTYIYPETYWGQQIGSLQMDVNQYNQVREVEGIVFACAYIKREVIEKCGLLDEDYFSYFEDTDYCFKAKEKGYKTICAGGVTLMHYQNASTDVNKVSFSAMFGKSQRTFRGKWDDRLSRKYKRKLAWHSIVNFPSGYAVSSKNLMLAMDKQGIDIRYKYVYGKGTPFAVDEKESSDNHVINVLKSRKFITDGPQVVYGQGDVFLKNSGKYKIGFTMLEVTGIPKTWVDNANKMDEVWVPSAFNRETFKNSGVKVPIHIIPLGIDPDFFNPQITSYKKNRGFTFLSVFEWGERKCPEKLLRAYANEFKKQDDVLLVCKVINNDGGIVVPEEIKKLNLPKNHAEIAVIYNHPIANNHPDALFIYSKELPVYQMGALYKSADCFVLLTRGEGWGMPTLEAMACGLPVITTNWSAQTEFLNDKNAYLLEPGNLVSAKAKCPYYAGFQWADPDESQLRYLMRYVYEHKSEAVQKGLYASEDVLKNWTWDKAAEKIIKRLESIG